MFTMPTEVYYGPGVIGSSEGILKKNGLLEKRFLLVRGNKSFEALKDNGLLERAPWLSNSAGEYVVSGEPTLDHLSQALKLARELEVEMVVSVGGGSPLDLGKAVAGLYFADPNDSVEDFFYKRKRLPNRKLPFIAIPTTSGTGSEVTTVSVLIDPGKYKGSIGYRLWFPDIAFTDPQLTHTLNERYTLSSGLDALTHALEAVASTGSDPLTMRLAWSAAETIFEILPELMRDLKNPTYRERMSWASLTAGLSFATSGLGLCHAIGHAIGLLYGVPHGLSVSAMLPAVWNFNAQYIDEKLRKYLDITAYDVLKRLEKFYQALGYDPKTYDLTGSGPVKVKSSDLQEIVRITFQGKSYKTNPRPSKEEDIIKLVEETFQIV